MALSATTRASIINVGFSIRRFTTVLSFFLASFVFSVLIIFVVDSGSWWCWTRILWFTSLLIKYWVTCFINYDFYHHFIILYHFYHLLIKSMGNWICHYNACKSKFFFADFRNFLPKFKFRGQFTKVQIWWVSIVCSYSYNIVFCYLKYKRINVTLLYHPIFK